MKKLNFFWKQNVYFSRMCRLRRALGHRRQILACFFFSFNSGRLTVSLSLALSLSPPSLYLSLSLLLIQSPKALVRFSSHDRKICLSCQVKSLKKFFFFKNMFLYNLLPLFLISARIVLHRRQKILANFLLRKKVCFVL